MSIYPTHHTFKIKSNPTNNNPTIITKQPTTQHNKGYCSEGDYSGGDPQSYTYHTHNTSYYAYVIVCGYILTHLTSYHHHSLRCGVVVFVFYHNITTSFLLINLPMLI